MTPALAFIDMRGMAEIWLFPHLVAAMLVPILAYSSMYRLQFTWRQGLCLALLMFLPVRLTWDAWTLAFWRQPDALAQVLSLWWRKSWWSIGTVFAVSAVITYVYWQRRLRKFRMPAPRFQETSPE